MKTHRSPTELDSVGGKRLKAPTLTAGSIARYFQGAGEPQWESSFAKMLERAELHSYSAETCGACGGEGYRVLTPEQLARWERRIAAENDQDRRHELRKQLAYESNCPACKGVGTRPVYRETGWFAIDSMFTTMWCWRCLGTGQRRISKRIREAATLLNLELGCERCREDRPADEKGNGYTVPITVRMTGSSRGGKPPKREPGGDGDLAVDNWVDEDMMVERGRVGREIEAIRKRNPVVGHAMDDYFGLQGDKWGGHKWGRTFSLWHHTAAGKQLATDGAKLSFRGHGFLIHPLDLIASERDAEVRAQAGAGNPRRRSLIAQADVQAKRLLREIEREVRETESAA